MPTYPASPVRERESLLISRATWGWAPDTETDVLRDGWQAWLDRQLNPSSVGDSAVASTLAGYRTLTNTNQQNKAIVDGSDDGWDQVVYELQHATLIRAVRSKRQLFEVMVDFWNNHFNCSLVQSGWWAHLKTVDDRTVARTHGLGRFHDLLLASARSPAMLVYLDNYPNDAGTPGGLNQNYGRELLELHTLGIIDGQHVYSEADVEAASRVLSGWSINEQTHVFQYRAAYHHSGPISFLGGAWSTPGASTSSAGQADGVAFLGFLARHRSTARHICLKLCRRFVSDDPPDALVEQLADVYQANDTAIAPVLRTLFHSEAFAGSSGAKVRRGLDHAVAVLRMVQPTLPTDPHSDTTRWVHAPWGVLAGLGHQIFGHDAPDGYSDDNADWISADGFLRRWEFAGWAAKGWLGDDYQVNPRAVLPSPVPKTGGALVDAIGRRLSGKVLSSPHHGFSDVTPGPFDQPISWMVEHGITTGYAGNTFRPDGVLNRAQVSTFLYRLVGEPTGAPATTFPDVQPGSYYADAVAWMVAEEITTGYGDGTFRPDGKVTRAQVSTFLWRLEGRPGGAPDNSFPDVRSSAFYAEAVSWMVWRGITTGYPDGTFRPDAQVTRAQISAFLYRLGFNPASTLSTTERNALLTFLERDEDEEVQDWLLWRVGDLNSLVLAFPAFQRK